MSKPKKPPDEDIDLSRKLPLHRTIKTSLKSIIRDDHIKDKINELVIKCNYIVSDTYQFIRLYCLYLYKNNKDIPKLNNTFISYCLKTMGIRDKRGKVATDDALSKELNVFYEKEYQPIFNHQKYNLTGLSFTIPYLVNTIETCIDNNLKEHFVKRLFRFINIFAGKHYDDNYGKDVTHDKEYNKNKKKLLWQFKKCIVENKYDEIEDEFKSWFEQYKENIIPDTFTKSIAYDCKVNSYRYVKYCFFMNAEYEKVNDSIKAQIVEKQNLEKLSNNEEEKEKLNKQIYALNGKLIKLFQPLSLRKTCIPKYITIDTATLMNLFSERGDKGTLLQNLKENQKMVWNKYFKMDKKVFRQREFRFNYTIQTDGVGTSILFAHQSLPENKYGHKITEVKNELHYIDELSDEQLEELNKKKIITADPGKKYLLYMADENRKELKYSCMQRDSESLAKRNRRIMQTNKKQHNLVELETKLSKISSKTVDYDKFKECIKIKHQTNEEVKGFYENVVNRKLNWRTKTYRHKSEDKFLDKIGKTYGNDSVIVIGDWTNHNSIKGLTSTMGIGIKKLVAKKYTTLLIDEYNTSKKCNICQKDVENVEINDKEIFRLLKCKNCSDKNTGSSESENKSVFGSPRFFTRDLNSCMNMHNIVQHMINNNRERPVEYRREENTKKKKSKLPALAKGKVGKSVVFAEGQASNLTK